MKKSLFLYLLLAIVSIMVTGCVGCQSEKKEQPNEIVDYHDYDGVVQDFTAGVGHIQALHRQTMYSLIGGKDYQWRNSRVILNDTITLENIDDLHITDINDVFYYWQDGPLVQYINSNVKDGLQVPWPIQDVWIEDNNLSEVEINLSAEDVLDRLKEWNGIIPSSKSLILRCPVGPKYCNAQWVIGNINNVIFIDAVTGEIRNWNPAFR